MTDLRATERSLKGKAKLQKEGEATILSLSGWL
jgi:hypothetical protein